MYNALDQYGGVDSGNDALVILSTNKGNDEESVVSSQRDYQVNAAWKDQVCNTLSTVEEEAEK